MSVLEEEEELDKYVDYDVESNQKEPSKTKSFVSLGDEEILNCISTKAVKKPGEQTSDFLLRITHLHCQRKRINLIADLRL